MTIQSVAPVGDVEARMAALHSAHSATLLNFLHALTGERHTAEDLLQETMLRTWRNIETVPHEYENARRWLFKVARRVTIDAFRMRQRRPIETHLLDYYVSQFSIADDTTESVVAVDSLRRAVHDLSEPQKTVIAELYFEGRSTLETADRLGVPIGTVKSRAHYALRTLREAVTSQA
jgi:RNA polymerase sigma-70 factor (ECF subfamily)